MHSPQGAAHQLRMRAAFTAHLVPNSAHGQPAVDGAEQTPELGPVLMVDEGATFCAGARKIKAVRCWLARRPIVLEHILGRGGVEDFERPRLQLFGRRLREPLARPVRQLPEAAFDMLLQQRALAFEAAFEAAPAQPVFLPLSWPTAYRFRQHGAYLLQFADFRDRSAGHQPAQYAG